jgi:hypothetical protein
MNRTYYVENTWDWSYMPVFLERFVLPILATLVVAVIFLNPLKFDRQQQLSLLLAVVGIAYFVGHTLHKNKALAPAPTAASAPAQPPKKSGDATTSGPDSPAITGDGNTVNSNQSPPPKK